MRHMFDTHCHLQDERLAGETEAVLQRAASAGIRRLLCCGSEEADWEPVRQLCARYHVLKPAFGLYPRYIGTRSGTWLANLRALALSSGAAIGEIGLDFAFEPRNENEQTEVFAAQLDLAAELDRPVSIHCRQAWGPMLALLRTIPRRPPALVFHSYSGSADIVAPLAELGGYFSFSGILTRHNNRRGQAAVKVVPPDRLLVETDAPDLLPLAAPDGSYPPSGTINEPANLICMINAVAQHRAASLESIAALTWQNAIRVFGE